MVAKYSFQLRKSTPTTELTAVVIDTEGSSPRSHEPHLGAFTVVLNGSKWDSAGLLWEHKHQGHGRQTVTKQVHSFHTFNPEYFTIHTLILTLHPVSLKI
jgi:hypothetical protein